MYKMFITLAVSVAFFSPTKLIAYSLAPLPFNSIEPYFGAAWDMDNSAGSNQSQPFDNYGTTTTQGDFNGDGFLDLAIGVPNRNIFAADVGGVVIIYGNQIGLTSTDSVLLVSGLIEQGEEFGSSLTAGDFNNDGFDDLAVGAPLKDFTNAASVLFEDTGAVYIHYGMSSGLNPTGQFIDADAVKEIGTDRQAGAFFGSALTSGDFNHDGFSDLVVAAPNQDVSSVDAAGMVFIYLGGQAQSANMGLTHLSRTTLHQNSPGIAGIAESNDFFGASLSAGDFNGNGFDDLVIGVPYEAVGSLNLAGVVQVIYGGIDGITNDDAIWEQGDLNGGSTEAIDLFGFALSTGDLNGDGYDELLIGAPNEMVNGFDRAGAAHVIFGGLFGLDSNDSNTISQDSPGIFGVPEAFDRFGYQLGSNDLDGDGYAEMFVGVPFESFNGFTDAGFAHILPGSAIGIDLSKSSYIGGLSAFENFGFSFATTENYYGRSLIIAAPGNTSADNDDFAGAVFELYYLNSDIIYKDGFDLSSVK